MYWLFTLVFTWLEAKARDCCPASRQSPIPCISSREKISQFSTECVSLLYHQKVRKSQVKPLYVKDHLYTYWLLIVFQNKVPVLMSLMYIRGWWVSWRKVKQGEEVENGVGYCFRQVVRGNPWVTQSETWAVLKEVREGPCGYLGTSIPGRRNTKGRGPWHMQASTQDASEAGAAWVEWGVAGDEAGAQTLSI